MSLKRIVTTGAVAGRKANDQHEPHATHDGYEGHEGVRQLSPPRQPLLPLTGSSSLIQSYGAADWVETSNANHGVSSRRSSPGVLRRESHLDRVPEEEGLIEAEEQELVREELETQGLYPGSYPRVVALYTLVPLSSLLVLALLAVLPILFWRIPDSRRVPHARYLPTPVPEIILSSALWSLAYLLRLPVYTIVSALLQRLYPTLASFIFHVIYAILFNALRMVSFPILRLRDSTTPEVPTWRDPVFTRVYGLAIGWAMIDLIVGIVQSYGQIALYKNVMVPEERIAQALESSADSRPPSLEDIMPLSPRYDPRADEEQAKFGRSSPATVDEAIRLAVDKDLEQLVNLKEREDLEEIYGMPVIDIPVFVSCLQKIASILLSFGLTLVLAASYLRSSVSLVVFTTYGISPSSLPFTVAFSLVSLLNLFLSLLYTPLVLPRIGVHTAAYIGFLFGLGSFFTGLGLWDALA